KPHFAPKAKRVIYLFMAGGPAQMDLLDYKPTLEKLHGTELPASVRMGQRLTGMTSGQSAFPVVKSIFKFAQHGKCGAWVSELIPNIAEIVDDIAIVKTVNTEAINHDPAITFIQTGFQQPGRPCMGAWLSYGLGSENKNLPAFIVMISNGKESDQPLYTRLWSSGFLPSEYQGVNFRGTGDPVLRSEEHTSELQSRGHLVCRLLLEKKRRRLIKFMSIHELQSIPTWDVAAIEKSLTDVNVGKAVTLKQDIDVRLEKSDRCLLF